jgi:tRNA-splicing ligase RtcB
MQQARNLANLSVTFHHVALMPDCHVGYGMPIGGVIACREAVIPNAVGVDIGCGVVAARTDHAAADLPANLIREILRSARERIPVGFSHHKQAQDWDGWERAPLDSPPVRSELDSARRQLGTLGGGNHFIELQGGQDGFLWLMIHSGSRNFGLKIAEHYHRVAQRLCSRKGVPLPSKDLAWLPQGGREAGEYLAAMQFALDFAQRNRELMMERLSQVVRDRLDCQVEPPFGIHHNYCRAETHFGQDVIVHRKGATSAGKGQTGIVPGSMGSPSYIVRGLGNPDAFSSCSHGAGRRLGRRQANRVLSEDACRAAMHGIVFDAWSRDRKGRVDLSEAPQAYKDIDEVMSAQADLVEVVTRLQPLGVVKG